MSFHVFFAFSTGLSKSIMVPPGTFRAAMDHVEEVERTLQLKREKYKDNPIRWDSCQYREFQHIESDELLCRTISAHNRWVRRLYDQLAKWSEHPPEPSEELTPAMAAEFWHGLVIFDVPANRWTRGYSKERMEHYYDVMRGNESEGVTFNAKALKPEQADAVLCLFADFIDPHDCRAAVPVGRDCIAFSDDGGYGWCAKCGAIAEDEIEEKVTSCRKRGGCPLRDEYGEIYENEDESS